MSDRKHYAGPARLNNLLIAPILVGLIFISTLGFSKTCASIVPEKHTRTSSLLLSFKKITANSTLPKSMAIDRDSSSAFSGFYTRLHQTIKYPKKASQKNIEGRVYASFTVDQKHHIQNLSMLKGPAVILNEEIMRSLQALRIVVHDAKPGTKYILPVCFVMANTNDTKKNEVPAKYRINGADSPNSANIVLDEIVIKGYK